MTNKDILISICKKEIHREGIDSFMNWLEESDFFTAPASTKYHGNYEGGLCEHSINVYNQLVDLCGKYCNNLYTLETIAIAALFHDICKVNFYKKGTRNIKDENGMWVAKQIWEIDEKIPLGHGEKSCIILQSYMKLTLEELYAIRWHMNGFDNAVKGGDYSLSKAQDISKLVTLLSVADLLSSHLLEKKED